MKDLLYSVDKIVFNDGLLFIQGWVALENKAETKVILTIKDANCIQHSVELVVKESRPDVVRAEITQDSFCGFVKYISINTKTVLECELNVCFQGKTLESIDLIKRVEQFSIAMNASSEKIGLYNKAIKFVNLIKKGDWKKLSEKLKNLYFHRSAKDGRNIDFLSLELQKYKNSFVFIIDHAMGGGANTFRSRMIEECLSNKKDVALWSYAPYMLTYQLEIFSRDSKEINRYQVNWDALISISNNLKIDEIYFNNCAGYPNQIDIPEKLIDLKNKSGGRLIVKLHDFNLICPSYFLLNCNNVYCDIPAVDICGKCLMNQQDDLIRLNSKVSIVEWRSKWLNFLNNCDEITYFSNNTRVLFEKAFPGLAPSKLNFVPHKIKSINSKYNFSPSDESINIAAVGNITLPKGFEILHALNSEIQQNGESLKLSVIGTIEDKVGCLKIFQTGSYKQEDLGDLLNKNKIQIVLMSSIYPETFSYVTHELMHLSVPILCFDLGAQAEVVKKYKYGKVVPFCNSRDLIKSIKNFSVQLNSMQMEAYQQ